MDSPVKADFTSNAGKLVLLFTDQHTNAEIGFETGTFRYYEPELESVIKFLFPGWSGKLQTKFKMKTPLAAARCKGVTPFSSFAFISAPAAMSSSAISLQFEQGVFILNLV
jgi:hypothetical protein